MTYQNCSQMIMRSYKDNYGHINGKDRWYKSYSYITNNYFQLLKLVLQI